MKRKNKIKIYYINKKYENICLIIVFIISSFYIYLSYENKYINRELDLNNEIKITIKGTGKQYIISEESGIIPSEIYVNGEKQNTAGRTVNLVEEENIIILKWNSPLTNCSYLFYNLSNIIKVDLSKFESSSITKLNSMFSGCSKLTTIIFDNFNTSLVEHMRYMFSRCNLLISLNLSMFDTSKATNMHYMFRNCSSLTTLDLSYFIEIFLHKKLKKLSKTREYLIMKIAMFRIKIPKFNKKLLFLIPED